MNHNALLSTAKVTTSSKSTTLRNGVVFLGLVAPAVVGFVIWAVNIAVR